MRRAFLDTNVFLYALGAAHPYREPCRRLVSRLAAGEVVGETSVEVVQEIVHVRRRAMGHPSDATARAREVAQLCREVHAVDRSDLSRALELLDRHDALTTRDAMHAAVALNRGIDAIVTADRHFDAIPTIERIDPAAPTIEKLLG